MESTIAILPVLLLFFFNSVTANIHEQLSYFETLKISDISHRTKRSVDPDPNSNAHITEIKLNTLGRPFHLYLKPSKILSRGFKGSVVRADGREEQISINAGAMLSGSLAGDPHAVVNVNYEDSGNILANIMTDDDTYIIEPSWRLMGPSTNHTMVAYKQSNMKVKFPDAAQHIHSTCGIREGNGKEDAELHGKVEVQTEDDSKRSKRQSPYLGSRTTCQLMVVADHLFFEHMGGGSISGTAIYMINVIQIVSSIYRQTDFDESGNSMTGIGFEVAEMRIHNESHPPTAFLQKSPHYNRAEAWATKDLLEAFSMDKYLRKFCLAHLFTFRSFEDGVLGLAYIASERRSAVGGICSPMYPKYNNGEMTLNTGWSSSRNAGGHRVLALQSQLVTAHEFGHNFGSEHDPETDLCAPSDYGDGKYIMYPWAVSGYDKNNKLFSPCSRKFIFKVLKAKGFDCFTADGSGDGGFCGNGRIDEGEMCDGGWNTKNDLDPCCNNQCQLRRGKSCSPMNYGCCSATCQPAPKGTVCRRALEGTCDDEIVCDGISKQCPNITKSKDDNTTCIDQGTCRGGKCLNFCEMFDPNLTPCICAKESGFACHRCCKQKYGNNLCQSINNTLLPDGRPCYQGLCTQGVCVKKRQDMVQRLFNIIEDISIDQLVAFMRSNIVGTVIVLSLLIWIPASCTVSFIDRREARKERAKRDWQSRSNRTLFVGEESKYIKKIPNVRVPRHLAAGSVVRPREHGEPTVRWPESTWDNPAPARTRVAGPPIFRMTDRSEGIDIGPENETVV